MDGGEGSKRLMGKMEVRIERGKEKAGDFSDRPVLTYGEALLV